MVPRIEANFTPGQPGIDAFYSETPPGIEENFLESWGRVDFLLE
jgi:hypothetical protein